MSATSRAAVPGLMPVHDVLSHEERITRLERENAELRQMLREQAYAIGALHAGMVNAQQALTLSAQNDRSLQAQIGRITQTQQGDLRLSEILGGIEQRLALVELGVCR